MPIRIAASLLAANPGRLIEAAQLAEAEGADWLHIDVMDGHFVADIAFGPTCVAALRAASTLPFDVHLMVKNPLRHIAAFALAGANSISFHPEAADDVHATCRAIRAHRVLCGLALSPTTPLTALTDLKDPIDFVNVLGVTPGACGQTFQPETLRKIKTLATWRGQLSHTLLIEVDGGVDVIQASAAKAVGADILVCGKALYGAPSFRQAIEELKGGEG